jgi:hypothetical protein
MYVRMIHTYMHICKCVCMCVCECMCVCVCVYSAMGQADDEVINRRVVPFCIAKYTWALTFEREKTL